MQTKAMEVRWAGRFSVPATVPVMATMSDRRLVKSTAWRGRRMLTLADAHADSTHEEKVTTTELLDHVQTREGGDDVDRVGDDRGDEGVLETSILKVLSAIVDCKLLARISQCRIVFTYK
jgi:hypothetical protein